jgi:hypothetical protein
MLVVVLDAFVFGVILTNIFEVFFHSYCSTVKIPERIARDDIYDYNYYMTEDDDFYQPKIVDSNVLLLSDKQNILD